MKNSKEFTPIFVKFQEENEIEYFGRTLGKGAYGEVREAKLKNSSKTMAVKLFKKQKEDDNNEIIVAQEIRGFNIIRIVKTISKIINGEEYILIIMEKALLRDLGKLNEYYYKFNLLKLIKEDIFVEKIGDNLLRFYAKQIIDGLEILDRTYFVHFDIKPENLLINLNLNIKISDFSLVTKIKNGDIINIPGGTLGYLSPEYYNKEKVSSEIARKQDYFALGSTLFYLKNGKSLLKYQKDEDPSINMDRVFDFVMRGEEYIKSRQPTEEKFIKFVCNLIKYNPEERINFEQIYRNEWLNTNKEVIEDIVHCNENDEEKIIMELQKSDFLINKERDLIVNNTKKYIFKKKIKIKNLNK